ncbi:MAG: CopG family transcriptional regulator, partial [Thermoflexus sp.]
RRIQIVLEEEQYRWLRHEAGVRGVSISSLIREAIEAWRARDGWPTIEQSAFWKLVGKGRSGQRGPAISEHVDDWLYPPPQRRRKAPRKGA